jgi:hypothetical protein
MFNYFNPFNIHTLILACLLLPMSMAVLGCDAQDGPAEKAGEKLDEAGEEIQDEVDDHTRD